MIFMDASETLASAFYAQFSGSVVEPVEALLDLDSVLRQLVISGRTAWPDLPLSAMAFVSYLARRVPRREPVLKSLFRTARKRLVPGVRLRARHSQGPRRI